MKFYNEYNGGDEKDKIEILVSSVGMVRNDGSFVSIVPHIDKPTEKEFDYEVFMKFAVPMDNAFKSMRDVESALVALTKLWARSDVLEEYVLCEVSAFSEQVH